MHALRDCRNVRTEMCCALDLVARRPRMTARQTSPLSMLLIASSASLTKLPFQREGHTTPQKAACATIQGRAIGGTRSLFPLAPASFPATRGRLVDGAMVTSWVGALSLAAKIEIRRTKFQGR